MHFQKRIVLFFVRRKTRKVLTLEQEIYSNDEIGILARELNNLRISLNDNRSSLI